MARYGSQNTAGITGRGTISFPLWAYPYVLEAFELYAATETEDGAVRLLREGLLEAVKTGNNGPLELAMRIMRSRGGSNKEGEVIEIR